MKLNQSQLLELEIRIENLSADIKKALDSDLLSKSITRNLVSSASDALLILKRIYATNLKNN